MLQIRGLLTYRATTDRRKHDRLNIAYLATPVDSRIDTPILNTLQQLHAVAKTLFYGDLVFGEIQHVERFPVNHTV